MPNYEFECPACEHRFSKLLPVGSKEATCLICGTPAQKLLSAPAVHFKGSGFYASGKVLDSSSKKSENTDASKKSTGETPACSGTCQDCPSKTS